MNSRGPDFTNTAGSLRTELQYLLTVLLKVGLAICCIQAVFNQLASSHVMGLILLGAASRNIVDYVF